MPDRTLLLVDGMAVAYRAFHAIQGLSTSDGRPTNALFGFIKMLRQLEQTWRPTHWSVVFDGGLPKERMELLQTYKAQRAEMPDDLRQQLEPINEYLELSEVSSVRLLGEEADDAMATLVSKSRPEGARVLLATSDKDLFQLVGDNVSIVSPIKEGGRMGPEEVRAKTGVGPDRIVEWLALTGDSSDNIPGVPGVGPKTAAKWLAQFGSLESLLARPGEISSDKLREALLAHRENVLRNLRLLRLRTDLPCAPDWDAMKVRSVRSERLKDFLEMMEFHSMARALDEAPRDPRG